MATRVTNLETSRALIDQLFTQRNQLETVRQQISSGLKVQRPSNDPARASTISQLRGVLQRIDSHNERISFAQNILGQQDTLLSSSEEAIVRAKEIATAAANGTLSPELRAVMADEVFGIRDTLVAIGNTKIDGVYIYAGADNDDPPFDAATYTEPATGSASERYVFDDEDGTDVNRTVQITDTQSVRITTSGDEIFSNAIAALERLGRSLSGYTTTLDGITGLPDGGGTAYTFPDDYDTQTSDIASLIDTINTVYQDVQTERSSLGTRINQLDEATQTLAAIKVTTEESRSAIQDVDIFEASSTYANLQTGLQALLTSGAQLNQLSLMDFL